VLANRVQIEEFELPVANLMKQHHQRHPLRHGQAALPRAMALAIGQQSGVELRFERFVKVVHQAVSLGKIVHDEGLRVTWLIRSCTQSTKTASALIRFSSMR